jgi:hypothetical protein
MPLNSRMHLLSSPSTWPSTHTCTCTLHANPNPKPFDSHMHSCHTCTCTHALRPTHTSCMPCTCSHALRSMHMHAMPFDPHMDLYLCPSTYTLACMKNVCACMCIHIRTSTTRFYTLQALATCVHAKPHHALPSTWHCTLVECHALRPTHLRLVGCHDVRPMHLQLLCAPIQTHYVLHPSHTHVCPPHVYQYNSQHSHTFHSW